MYICERGEACASIRGSFNDLAFYKSARELRFRERANRRRFTRERLADPHLLGAVTVSLVLPGLAKVVLSAVFVRCRYFLACEILEKIKTNGFEFQGRNRSAIVTEVV